MMRMCSRKSTGLSISSFPTQCQHFTPKSVLLSSIRGFNLKRSDHKTNLDYKI